MPESPLPDVARRAAVVDAIRAAAGPDGFVPFDRFESIALYAPGVGYYTSGGRRLGPSGDFYTAAHVSPVFGETLADRLVAEHRRLGSGPGFRVVELGAGDAALAAAVVPRLSALLGDSGWTYTLVDRSPTLRATLSERLEGVPGADRVRVGASLAADGPFRGAVVANELLDALPVRRLRRRSGRWVETGVRWAGERFVWAEAEPRPVVGRPPPEDVPEGTVLELSEAVGPLLREIADHLVAGAVLLLDYGGEEPELLARGDRGTLQAVRAHRPLEDPLVSPGEVDLSVLVNFTRVREDAERAGLELDWFGRQSAALGRWGFELRLADHLARAASPTEEVRVRLAAKNLLFGFDSFRVMELRAGGAAPLR